MGMLEGVAALRIFAIVYRNVYNQLFTYNKKMIDYEVCYC